MNESRAIAALSALAKSAGDLADICEREAPEFSGTWRSISSDAEALCNAPSREAIESLRRAVRGMFAYHPGAFTEVYIVRDDPGEGTIENERFELVKERISAASAELGKATREGEINFGAVRRHFTDLETALLEAGYLDVGLLRAFLNNETNDVATVLELIAQLESRSWSPPLDAILDARLAAVRRDFRYGAEG